MKFAILNEEKTEAFKGANALCIYCNNIMVAKCGEKNINHWAHKVSHNCDRWWENETKWHRYWKNLFPTAWQEQIHINEKTGEKHIADIKTEENFVLEFQHSFINSEERFSRNNFYKKICWVIDGTRRKTDKSQFEKSLKDCLVLSKEPLILQIHYPEECRLLKEWHNEKSLVFFDFNGDTKKDNSLLWFLFPKTINNKVYLSQIFLNNFVEMHNNNEFDNFVVNKVMPIQDELISNFLKKQKILKSTPLRIAENNTRHFRARRRNRRL